ncbi:hypothetical protein ACFL0U_03715, partial [Pseudomonadota bacterium]
MEVATLPPIAALIDVAIRYLRSDLRVARLARRNISRHINLRDELYFDTSPDSVICAGFGHPQYVGSITPVQLMMRVEMSDDPLASDQRCYWLYGNKIYEDDGTLSFSPVARVLEGAEVEQVCRRAVQYITVATPLGFSEQQPTYDQFVAAHSASIAVRHNSVGVALIQVVRQVSALAYSASQSAELIEGGSARVRSTAAVSQAVYRASRTLDDRSKQVAAVSQALNMAITTGIITESVETAIRSVSAAVYLVEAADRSITAASFAVSRAESRFLLSPLFVAAKEHSKSAAARSREADAASRFAGNVSRGVRRTSEGRLGIIRPEQIAAKSRQVSAATQRITATTLLVTARRRSIAEAIASGSVERESVSTAIKSLAAASESIAAASRIVVTLSGLVAAAKYISLAPVLSRSVNQTSVAARRLNRAVRAVPSDLVAARSREVSGSTALIITRRQEVVAAIETLNIRRQAIGQTSLSLYDEMVAALHSSTAAASVARSYQVAPHHHFLDVIRSASRVAYRASLEVASLNNINQLLAATSRSVSIAAQSFAAASRSLGAASQTLIAASRTVSSAAVRSQSVAAVAVRSQAAVPYNNLAAAESQSANQTSVAARRLSQSVAAGVPDASVAARSQQVSASARAIAT